MPAKVIEKLLQGNAEYVSALTSGTDISAASRRKLAQEGQNPFAVIITCSDSRVVPEYIFSCGLGELFVIRTAGNVVGEFERATAEYGALHLGAETIVVMGHTGCGAVNAAIEETAHKNDQHKHHEHPKALEALIGEVSRGIAKAREIGGNINPVNAVKQNITYSAEKLLESEAIKRAEFEGNISIYQAIYNIETGNVEFFS